MERWCSCDPTELHHCLEMNPSAPLSIGVDLTGILGVGGRMAGLTIKVLL